MARGLQADRESPQTAGQVAERPPISSGRQRRGPGCRARLPGQAGVFERQAAWPCGRPRPTSGASGRSRPLAEDRIVTRSVAAGRRRGSRSSPNRPDRRRSKPRRAARASRRGGPWPGSESAGHGARGRRRRPGGPRGAGRGSGASSFSNRRCWRREVDAGRGSSVAQGQLRRPSTLHHRRRRRSAMPRGVEPGQASEAGRPGPTGSSSRRPGHHDHRLDYRPRPSGKPRSDQAGAGVVVVEVDPPDAESGRVGRDQARARRGRRPAPGGPRPPPTAEPPNDADQRPQPPRMPTCLIRSTTPSGIDRERRGRPTTTSRTSPSIARARSSPQIPSRADAREQGRRARSIRGSGRPGRALAGLGRVGGLRGLLRRDPQTSDRAPSQRSAIPENGNAPCQAAGQGRGRSRPRPIKARTRPSKVRTGSESETSCSDGDAFRPRATRSPAPRASGREPAAADDFQDRQAQGQAHPAERPIGDLDRRAKAPPAGIESIALGQPPDQLDRAVQATGRRPIATRP